jgi:hypothetical protein
MKKNTCWFFGDSFTQCLALRGPGPYLDFKNMNPTNNKWTDIVADELGLISNVNARGGRSPQKIFMDALSSYNQFKEGDFVIFTDSPYIRTEGVNFSTNEITTYNNEQVMYGRFDLGLDSDTSHGMPVSLEKSKILVDYLYEFIIPFEDVWERYWIDNFSNLCNLFNKSGINTLYWSHRLWANFPSITDETKGMVIDDHWGIEGNSQFAKFILSSIKQNKKILLRDGF